MDKTLTPANEQACEEGCGHFLSCMKTATPANRQAEMVAATAYKK